MSSQEVQLDVCLSGVRLCRSSSSRDPPEEVELFFWWDANHFLENRNIMGFAKFQMFFFVFFFFFDPSDYWKYIDASRWTWITYWIRRFLKFIIDFYVLFLINLLASLCLSLFGHTCWGTLPTLWCFFFGAVFEQICVLLPCHRHSGRFSISPSDGFLKSCQQLLQFHFVGLANAQFAFVLCGEACVFAIDIRHYIGRYPWKEKAGPSSHDDDTRMSHNS